MSRAGWAVVVMFVVAACGGGAGPASTSSQTASISIAPQQAQLAPATQLSFSYALAPGAGTAVTWSVAEGTSGGTVSTSGLYTAPASAGTYHVVVTSQANAAISASATVTVSSATSAKESWIWPYNTNTGWPPEMVAIASNARSFTHLSPAFYDLNYATPYVSGVPYYVTCAGGVASCTGNGPNNFGTFAGLGGTSASYNGQTITTQSFTSWAHALGFKVVPLIYGGAGNGGVDSSVQAILCGGGGASGCAAQTAFIDALVTELVANDYDGWNLDWEMGAAVGSSYATSFVSFVNALKARLVAAGRPAALVTVDVIVSNINGTWCSSNNGFADFALLSTSAIDRVIIENYVGNFQTAGWTVPTSCPATLRNAYGSAVLSSSSPAGCDYSFSGMLLMMCAPNLGSTPALDFDKAVIGLMPSINGTNPIAGQAMQALQSFGFTKVAVWPQYDNASYPFMSTDGMVPATANWYSLLATFLGR